MRTKRDKLTQERLKELLHYDPETGIFTRIKTVSYQAKKGETVGNYIHNGYLCVGVDQVRYYLHRLAWLYVYGEFPPSHTDHINGDPLDNRICNLRLASASQNISNSKGNKNNTSGVKGLCWIRGRNVWRGYVKKNYKSYSTKDYRDKKDAENALRRLRERLHGGFANHG